MIYELSRQSSSSCSECQREILKQNPKQTFTEQRKITMPNKNAIFQQNLKLLHKQIEKLKEQNMAKDHLILELKKQMQGKYIKNDFHSEIQKQNRQLEQIKQQIKSPRVLSRSKQSVIPQTSFKDENSQMIMQQQLRKHREQLQFIRERNELLENLNRWMYKFIEIFIKMAHNLSLNHGQPLDLEGISLKKQTSISWRYVKNLLAYLLQK